jgi:GT2 family glycosyltransferase
MITLPSLGERSGGVRQPHDSRNAAQQISDKFVRATVGGKFLQLGPERFWVKGVSYGTFAPDENGLCFPPPARIAEDFTLMRRAGVNTVRTYTAPDRQFLDLAEQHGLRVMAGIPWADHVAFLDDRQLARTIKRDVAAQVRAIRSHPAILMLTLGNEIPASIVRWLGPDRVERFLSELYLDAKAIAPDTLFTYVNFPPTEYLNLPFLDLFAFNVYLHRERDLRAYLARLQNIAGHKPLLVAEAGADSVREGASGQASLTAMQLRSAFAEGACGAVAFAWTDEWWRGGNAVTDWAFGLVDAERRPKPALTSVADVFANVPFAATAPAKVSVVVCAYNAEATLHECLASLERLTYPDFEVIVVNDGSRDSTGAIARQYSSCRVIDVDHGGLSAARNAGLRAATGEIIAYTDADVRVDPDWLHYLVQPFATTEVVAVGGLSLPPLDSPWLAHCVARAPGGPTHVLLDDRTAEHVPGCNLAIRRDALSAIGGFNPIYLRAGDDVDVCWRLQAAGGRIEFAPGALVWHHHRSSVRAYWRQQVGYGEGESWLVPHHREKFTGAKIAWRGHIYSPLPFVRSLSRPRVNVGIWGSAAFPSVYHMQAFSLAFLPHTVRWQAASAVLVAIGLAIAWVLGPVVGTAVSLIGVAGLVVTGVQCLRYSLASDIESLPNIGGRSRLASRAIYRTVIAWLHVVQPFARAAGYLRGRRSPPETGESSAPSPRPTQGDLARALYLLGRGSSESRFWAERWIGAETLLSKMTDRLRRSPLAHAVEIEDGWLTGRDVRVTIGRFAFLDLRVLVENHGANRSLIRIGHRLQLSAVSIVAALAAAVWPIARLQGVASLTPGAAALFSLFGVLLAAIGLWRITRTLSVARGVLSALAPEVDMQPLRTRLPWPVPRHRSSDPPLTTAEPCGDTE